MKILSLIILIFFSYAFIKGNKSDCKKCSILIVRQISDKIDKLDPKDIYCFLSTFDESCENNAEFMEYSNETLFKVIKNYPSNVVSILSRRKDLQKEYIYKELASPLIDEPIEDIIKKVEKVNNKFEAKKKVLEALKKASK